jgi:hypothetical protein
VGGPEGVPQFDHPFPPARGARRRGRVIELADFQRVVAVCLVVVGYAHPRCSRKKRTGESREKNAGASVPEQRGRQQRRPSVHSVKHRSTSRTNTDVSVRSAEKCSLSVERSKEAQLCSSGSNVCELDVGRKTCLDPRSRGSARTCSLRCTLARSSPGRDTRSGQRALARRHTDGQLCADLLKTTVMCEV